VLIPSLLAAFVCLKTVPHLLAEAIDRPKLLSRFFGAIAFGASVRLFQVRVVSSLELEFEVIGCGILSTVCLFQTGANYSGPSSSLWLCAAFLLCGVVALVGMATVVALPVCGVVSVSAVILLVLSVRNKSTKVNQPVLEEEERGAAPVMMQQPTTFAELCLAIKTLPLVGERLSTIEGLYNKHCRDANAPFSLLVLCGERGIGKSRLVRELGKRGARLFVGNCGEEEKQSIPFSCFRESLSGLLGVNRFAPASEKMSVLSR
jgi:hypothetical protein